MPMTEEERTHLIKDTIESNLYLLLDYMEGYQQPSNDFLRILVSLQSQVDPDDFTELFVRVCTYQKIEDLRVTSEMVKNDISFLVDKKKDPKASYGLLRLIYFNKISLSSFPKTTLIRFQIEYEQTILRFFKSLPICETQVTESLPASAFCFTNPILKCIAEGGKIFTNRIPYQFLPFIVEITCYSFNDSEESFDKFLFTLKTGIKEHYNHLLVNNFSDLL